MSKEAEMERANRCESSIVVNREDGTPLHAFKCDLETGHDGLHECGPDGNAFLWGWEEVW